MNCISAGLVIVAAMTVAVPVNGQERVRASTVYEDLQMFSQVLNQIRINHPDSLDTHALFMAAIEGMIRATDPHSYILPATRLAPEAEQQWRDGQLLPLPIAFRFIGDAPVVVATSPGSRAARQDILPGDELITADGQPITAASVGELEIALAGPGGSNVELELERRRVDGSLVRLTRTVRRERVEDEGGAVTAAFMMPGNIGYVRLLTFATTKAADELHDALGDLEDDDMTGLVLDLRGNGGGLVEEAAKVAGEFLPRGSIVYTAAGRKAEISDTVRVERSFWRGDRGYPIILLVDRGTASAAELVAGALQDHDRALIVGRTTFGKALLMQPFPLTEGSIVMLVVGTIHTPCGRSIQRDYQSITRREYYRGDTAAGDTAGQPTCKTANGRTVRGGGGIRPDVHLPAPVPPAPWLERLHEAELPLAWAAGYAEARGSSWTDTRSLHEDQVADSAVADFRRFASQRGIGIPITMEADVALRLVLLPRLAGIRWGRAGFYRILAELDPEVALAAAELDRARGLTRN